MLTVFRGLNDMEYITYMYGPIFWNTYVYGEPQESYDRRVAIIDYLNEQEDIKGMFRGDVNENGIIDSEDYELINDIASGRDVPINSMPEDTGGSFDDGWFYYCYFSIVGDVNGDGSEDANDMVLVNSYTETQEIENNRLAKYYPESETYSWLEEEFMLY